jgi:hypothetical protein
MMAYQETFVQRDQHRIYVRDHPGAEPAIILMHGFPDNVHLYDRLSPYLSPPRRVVLFDFLGWGSSDKPSGYPYTTDNQVGDLDAAGKANLCRSRRFGSNSHEQRAFGLRPLSRLQKPGGLSRIRNFIPQVPPKTKSSRI